MNRKALTILTVLGLLCLPLAAAAQDSEDPMPNDPAYEQPVAAPDAEAEINADAQMQSDQTAADQSAVDESAEEELPATASPLALLALLGSAGFATGMGLRLRRRR